MGFARNDVEGMLVNRVGPLLTAAGMSVSHESEPGNEDLNDPIGRALYYLGYTVDDRTAITDADVAQVTDAQYDEFLDVAVLHTLQAILGNLDDVDITVGPRSEKLSQLAGQVERKLKRAEKRATDLYGYGLTTLGTGVLYAPFAEHD